MEFKEEFESLKKELKTYFDKAAEDVKAFGAIQAETKAALEKLETRADELQKRADTLQTKTDEIQKQTDAIDLQMKAGHHAGGQDDKSLGELFTESEEYKAAKAGEFTALRSKDGRIRAAIPQLFTGRKTVITTTGIGSGTTGVQMPFRLGGITELPRQELRIRDLMPVRQMTSGNSFDYVRQLARTNNASPQIEGEPKSESTYTWESKSDTIKTIAHFTNVSRQAIEDIPWLQSAINSELMYGLLIKEEQEILSGNGLNQHLNGLITQATAYNTGLNVAADTKLDKLRHAKLQARLIGLGTFAPSGIVLSPTDMHSIELIKTEEGGANTGLYIIGDPRTGPAIKLLWGLPVVESDSIATGKFLVGAFATAAELIDRMQAMIEISFEHNVNFTSNLATILCEERLGMAVRRPDAFVYGSF